MKIIDVGLTLQNVTDAGGTTTNNISVGGFTADGNIAFDLVTGTNKLTLLDTGANLMLEGKGELDSDTFFIGMGDLDNFDGGAKIFISGSASKVELNKQLQLHDYGGGTYTGTAAKYLAVEADGDLIEVDVPTANLDGSGTQNYVSKWSDADTLTDSTIYDDGDVGIGTSTPSHKLNVIDSSASYVAKFVGSSTSYIITGDSTKTGASGYNSVNDQGQMFLAVGSDGVVGLSATSGATQMKFSTGGTEAIRIDSSQRVGIGTTTPSASLEISKSETTEYDGSSNPNPGPSNKGLLKITNTDTTATQPMSLINFRLDKNGGDGWLGFIDGGATNEEHFVLGNQVDGEILRAESGGNVSIGTSSPLAKFHVIGSGADIMLLEKSGGDDALRINSSGTLITNGAAGTGILSHHAVAHFKGTTLLPSIRLDQGSTGTGYGGYGLDNGRMRIMTNLSEFMIAFDNEDNTQSSYFTLAKSNGQIKIAGYGSGTHTGTAAKYLAVKSDGGIIEADVPTANLDGSGTQNYIPKWSDSDTLTDSVVYDDGTNVGIGTTSPSAKLEVLTELSSTDGIDYPFVISSHDPNNSINQDSGSGVGLKFRIAGNDATSPADSVVGASIAAIREMDTDTNSSTGLGFFISQNDETLDEALRIDHDGNLGIGTSSPSAKLHIDNHDVASTTVRIDGGATADAIVVYGNGGNKYFELGEVGSDDPATLSLFKNEVNTIRLKTDGNSFFNGGNVGIGTTSPSAQLHIQNFAASNYALRFAYTDGTDGGGFYESTSTDLSLFLKDNTATTKVQIASDGDSYFNGGSLGIGTSSPSAKLEISANDQSAARIRLTNTNTASGGDSIEFVAGIPNVGQDGFSIRNATTNQTQLVILGDGNLGIGTTTPNHKLVVSGNTLTTNLYVKDAIIHDGDTDTKIEFGTDTISFDTGGVEAMFIDSTGDVGIGTDAPDEKVHINGRLLVEDNFILGRNNSTDATNKSSRYAVSHYTNTEEPLSIVMGTTTASSNLVILGGGSSLANTATTVAIYTATDTTTTTGTEALRVNNSQNVGIGTGSSISAKLNVKGHGNTSGTNALLVENSDGDDLFRVYNNGLSKVNGILDVNGTASGALQVSISSGSYPIRYASSTSSNDIFLGVNVNDAFLLYVNGADRLSVASTGQVAFNDYGIGTFTGTAAKYLAVTSAGEIIETDTPAATLQAVTDAGNETTNQITINETGVSRLKITESTLGTGATTDGFDIQMDSGRNAYLWNREEGTLIFATDNTDRGRFDSSGNFGIGTGATLSAKLHVLGGGTNNTTDALLVEDSAGQTQLKVTNGNEIYFNSSTNHYGVDASNTTSGYVEKILHVDYGGVLTGTTAIYTSESNKDAIMCDYKVFNGTDMVIGTVSAVTDGTTTSITNIVKAEIGDTSDISFTATLSTGTLVLNIVLASAGWDAKYIIKNF